MRIKTLLLVLLTFLNGFLANGNGKIKMIFRYDDYILMPSQLNDSLVSIFKKYDIPLCIGIIPFDDDNVFINQLNENQISDLRSRIQRNEIEVAMHGFNHNNNVKTSFLKRKYSSEFATLSYTDQYKKLEKGKRGLDSLLQINIQTFIPPFNTYDKYTLKALSDLGFGIISAALAGDYSGKEIKYMPATYQDFSGLPEMIKRYKDEDVTIIIYFHPYSVEGFSSNNSYREGSSKLITINHLDTLLNWTKKQNVSFYTFSDLARSENFDKALYKANFLNNNLLIKILNKFKLNRYGVYSTLEFHKKHKEFILGNILLHLLIFIFVYFIITALMKMFNPKLSIVISFFSILIVTIVIYLYYFSNDYGFKMKLIILGVIFFAAILGVIRKKRQLIQHS